MAEGYEAVITSTADGQHNPAELPKLSAYKPAGRLIIGRRDFSHMRRCAVWPIGRAAWPIPGRWGSENLSFDNQSGYADQPPSAWQPLLDRNLERSL